ncbi:dTDP-4-dehydrorhamnose reductase [candidate division KSB1 bacterium]
MGSLKILLTGCHGLLGQRIVQSITGDVFVHGVDIDDSAFIHGKQFEYSRIDITKRREVAGIVRSLQPDWIINAAAFTDVDACETEKEKCWRINVESVEHLCHYARACKAKLIHLSTDYIFDNRKELYTEDDRAAPLSYYGKSKLASENTVRASGPDWAIIRTSTLYDVDMLKGRNNFVTWVIHNLQRREKIRVVTDQWGNPTLARNLAGAIWRVITGNERGVFHVAGRDVVDRYRFTRAVAEKFNLDHDLIFPVTTDMLDQKAQRPLKIGLDTSKAARVLEIPLLGLAEGLDLFKKDYLKVHRIN